MLITPAVNLGSTTVNTTFADSASIDAFARLRVSNPVTLFDTQLQYGLNDILWENKVTNTSGNATVTHLSNESAVLLTVESNDTIVRQSRQYHRYQPGKSQLVMVTYAFAPGVANLTQRVGYFDGDNGVFMQLDGTDVSVVLRSKVTGSVVDTVVSQPSWNVDKLDGTGASGITLDTTKAQIFIADLEWLGVGRVRVGVVIDGLVYYVHEFLHANVKGTTYMTTANLPVRYEVSAGVVAGSHAMRCVCAQVSSEGGVELSVGIPFAISNAGTLRSVGNVAFLPLLSIRPKALYNGITNRSFFLPENFGLYSQDQSIYFKLVFGATLTGTSWSDVNSESALEYDVSATSFTGGIDVFNDYASAVTAGNSGGAISTSVVSRLPLALDIDGNHPTSPFTDSFTVAAISLSGSTDCGAAIDWKELR